MIRSLVSSCHGVYRVLVCPSRLYAARAVSLLICLIPVAAGSETFVVTSPAGLVTAIDLANTNGEADTIQVQPNVAGTVLVYRELVIEDDVDILGPGANRLEVSGRGLLRAFTIKDGVTATMSGLTITDGFAGVAGAIINRGHLTLRDCVVSDNSARGNAGAILNYGTLVLERSELRDNIAGVSRLSNAGSGGAIVNAGCSACESGGMLRIVDSTIADNVALWWGGGIASGTKAILTIESSTFTANQALLAGGGAINSGDLTMVNSTLSGNIGPRSHGGGVLNHGTARIRFSTLVGNTGGGIWNDEEEDVLVVEGSILADNTVPGSSSDCHDGIVIDEGGNFDTDDACPLPTVSTEMLALGPLVDNGGPTRTHALSFGSVAIDAAASCGSEPLVRDQRGSPRPIDGDRSGSGACDAGSYELFLPPTVLEIPSIDRVGATLLSLLLAALATLWLRRI